MKRSYALAAAWIAVGLFGVIESASAASTVTYNLTGNRPDASSYAFTQGGIGLTLKPGQISSVGNPTLYLGDKVTQSGNGVGVRNSRRDNGQIDGAGYNDVLAIYFSEDVTLLSMVLVGGSNGESYYYVEDTDGNGLLTGDLIGGPFPVGTSPFTIDFTTMSLAGADFTGDTFGVGTTCYACAWRVNSITVSSGGSIPAAPLPAALPLLATGLAGLAFLGHRRRRKPA